MPHTWVTLWRNSDYHSINYMLQTGQSWLQLPTVLLHNVSDSWQDQSLQRDPAGHRPSESVMASLQTRKSLSCQQKCTEFVFKICFQKHDETWHSVDKLKTAWLFSRLTGCPTACWGSPSKTWASARLKGTPHWASLSKTTFWPAEPCVFNGKAETQNLWIILYINVSLSTRLRMPRISYQND